MKIDITKVTEKQIMSLEVGLLQYTYIQRNFKKDDEDFRDVFTDFYLTSQARMRNVENRVPFFELMKKTKPNDSLITIVEKLYKSLPIGMYEFSFATKLLHTINTNSPIYDSKVYKYLRNDEKVDLWDIHQKKFDSAGKEMTKLEKIDHNWIELNNWYSSFLKTVTFKNWIAWFDKSFPKFASISNIKKVDFIIFSCSGY